MLQIVGYRKCQGKTEYSTFVLTIFDKCIITYEQFAKKINDL